MAVQALYLFRYFHASYKYGCIYIIATLAFLPQLRVAKIAIAIAVNAQC